MLNIENQISIDIRDEFNKIQDDLKIHLKDGFEISQTKKFLSTHVPKEIIYRAEILLDTLLNYLMDQALKNLDKADTKLQNKFFDEDFRKRIEKWVIQLENKLQLEPDVIQYSTDPRLKHSLIVGGLSFIIGSLATTVFTIKAKTVTSIVGKAVVSYNPYLVTTAIITGLAALTISSIIFKRSYDKAAPKSRDKIRTDINEYLSETDIQVKNWLKTVKDSFDKEFETFCSTNGFNFKEV